MTKLDAAEEATVAVGTQFEDLLGGDGVHMQTCTAEKLPAAAAVMAAVKERESAVATGAIGPTAVRRPLVGGLEDEVGGARVEQRGREMKERDGRVHQGRGDHGMR